MAGIIDDTGLEYKGTRDRQPAPGAVDRQGRPLQPYLPSEDIVEVVNLAIWLQRPLLIKGEPGSGKTRLARAVAYELGLHNDYYEAWYIKSTSRARDGLYTYDAVGRLRDAQLVAAGRATDEEQKRSEDRANYVYYGPLGRAFLKDRRTMVLIDEIDKADIDFPNDLLLELDESRFIIEELDNREVRAQASPIIFITSNDEKDLPDAFLRRCLFHYIPFPTPGDLEQIVKAHFPHSPEQLVADAIGRFMELRQEMEKGQASKKVSTSELLDWFRLLRHYADDKALGRLARELLYPGVLLKSWDDYRQYSELLRKAETP